MLKGKAEIELTDVRTGEKEVFVEENMVTNALSHIFSDNLEGMFWYMQDAGSVWKNTLIPICPNALGGILLFSEKLNENAENLYAPSGNPCVGYSSNDVVTDANPKRGSMNQTESEKIENGYRFVFDFATSQGNGTISAVALTHKWGGSNYFGDPFGSNATSALKTNTYTWSTDTGTSSEAALASWRYANCVEIDFENDLMYSIAMDTAGNVHIAKARKCFRKLRLNATLLEDGYDTVLDEITLTPTTAFLKPSSSANTYWSYYTFFDGRDGHWYGFLSQKSYGFNNSGDGELRWIKIRKSDYVFTEGIWTLKNAQLALIGNSSAYRSTTPSKTIRCAIRNGYLYTLNYSFTGLYKINLNNCSDTTYIPFGFTTYNDPGSVWVYTWKDYLCGYDFWLDENDRVFPRAKLVLSNGTATPLFEYGVYALSFGIYSSNYSRGIYKILRLVTPYLATINNLKTPVIKTADKTMKITYTVTETE